MKRGNFEYSFETSKPVSDVFNLLLTIEQWWSGLYEETIKGKSSKINDEFTFKAGGGAHYTKQKLVELIPNKKITWLVTDSNLNFLKDSSEWNGTQLHFELSTHGRKTLVRFIHEGLVPQLECYGGCSVAWKGYLEILKRNLG